MVTSKPSRSSSCIWLLFYYVSKWWHVNWWWMKYLTLQQVLYLHSHATHSYCIFFRVGCANEGISFFFLCHTRFTVHNRHPNLQKSILSWSWAWVSLMWISLFTSNYKPALIDFELSDNEHIRVPFVFTTLTWQCRDPNPHPHATKARMITTGCCDYHNNQQNKLLVII